LYPASKLDKKMATNIDHIQHNVMSIYENQGDEKIERRQYRNLLPVAGRKIFIGYSHSQVSTLESDKATDSQHKSNIEAPDAELAKRVTKDAL